MAGIQKLAKTYPETLIRILSALQMLLLDKPDMLAEYCPMLGISSMKNSLFKMIMDELLVLFRSWD